MSSAAIFHFSTNYSIPLSEFIASWPYIYFIHNIIEYYPKPNERNFGYFQIRFFLKFLSGAKALPSKIEMLKDTEDYMQQRKENGFKKYQSHFLGPNQV